MPSIRIAVIQLDNRKKLEGTLKNLGKHIKYVERKAPDLVVLPELWATGFNKKRIDRYFKNDGEARTLEHLKYLSRIYEVSIIGSIPHSHKEDEKFNAIPFIVHNGTSAPGTHLKWYHKMALFSALQEDTELGFRSGQNANREICDNIPIVDIPVHDKKTVRIGVSICGELRYPEQFYAYVANGCKVLINCSQWRGRRLRLRASPSHFEHWDPLLKTRAIESQCYVLGVNRIGRERDYEYEGASMLIDPEGNWVKPESIEVVPKSRYGEKIKMYEIPAGEGTVEGAGDLKLRRELSAFWFWESTNCCLWDSLTYRDNPPEMFVPFTALRPQKVDEKLCFTIMPLRDSSRKEMLKNEVSLAVQPFGFSNCAFPDDVPDAHIPNSIFEHIQKAGLIIADITGVNPNVLYEIGLAHALRKPIILIREKDDTPKPPFDISYIRYHEFAWKRKKKTQSKQASNLDEILRPLLQKYQHLIHTGSMPIV